MKTDPPLVTGLSPKEGIPGTLVTIRGENLGANAADLIGLSICGVDCLLTAKWDSSRKIVARCGPVRTGTTGEIIIVTKSGGRGTSTVSFRVYSVQIGPLQESAVWVDESKILPLRQPLSPASPIATINDNPLGFSVDPDDRVVSEADLSNMFLDGSGNLRLKNFEPAWYLLENYSSASFADLKKGLANMQRQDFDHREGPKDFLKSNLNSFICCLDALTELEAALESDTKHSSSVKWTENLSKSVDTCKSRATTLFSEVLNRKDQADSTRNALSILQRFKFLFYLPDNIEKSMENKDYQAVISGYSRAKNYVNTVLLDSDIPLFREAFQEIEKKMKLFKRTMREKLLEMPSTLEEQTKIIKYVSQLEPEEDPAWDCICAQHRWLQNQLWDLQRRFLKLATQERLNEDDDSDVEDHVLSGEIPQRFHFAEAIFSFLTSKVPPFWKLTQNYANELGNRSATDFVTNQGKVETMFLSLFRLAIWLILNAVLPDALPPDATRECIDRLASWPHKNDDTDDTLYLLNMLRSLRGSIAQLHSTDGPERGGDLEKLSEKHIGPLYELNVTIRLRCLNRILDQTVEGVWRLDTKENWKVNSTSQDYAKTQLPDLFENMVLEVLSLVRTVIATSPNCPAEMDLFNSEKLKHALVGSFEQLLSSFRDTLERLSRVSPDNSGQNRPTKLTMDGAPSFGSKSGKEAGIKERKLLIVLSNCEYCKTYSLKNLGERLAGIGVKSTTKMLQGSEKNYATLSGVLREAYISSKVTAMTSAIGTVNYAQNVHLNDVSSYVNDILLCMISVKSELFLLTPHLLPKLLPLIALRCLQRLTTHFSSLTNESSIARRQAYVDVSAAEVAFGSFLNDDSRNVIELCKSDLKVTEDDRIRDVLKRFAVSKKLLLTSLQDYDGREQEQVVDI